MKSVESWGLTKLLTGEQLRPYYTTELENMHDHILTKI